MTLGEHQDRRRTSGPRTTSADVREAALTLFSERGYHGTSLKQVAAQLELRVPSLYNHIESKGALLADIVLDTLTEVSDEFDAALTEADGPVDQLHSTTYVYALHHATHRREALIVNQDAQHLPEPHRSRAQDMRRAHEHRFRQIIIEGSEAGVFSVESPKLASFAIREMCVSIARWLNDRRRLSADEVAQYYSGQALRIVGCGRISG